MAVKNAPTAKGLGVWAILAAVSLACATALRAQSTGNCAPAQEVKAALDALPTYPTPAQTEKQFRADKLAKVQALLQQHPDDLFVQEAYISTQIDTPGWDELIAQYKARSAQNPDNPEWAYLYSLTLIGRNTPEAIKVLDALLEKDSTFARAHLKLSDIYTTRNFKDQDKVATNLKTYLAACPATFDGYSLLTRVDDKEFIKQAAAKLRAMVATRSDPDAVAAYSTLWSLEFKAHPPADYEALRKQVSADLQRLRALNLQDKRQWYATLEEGYKLVNDQKQSDWAKGERQKRFPRPWELAAREKWFKDREDSKPDDPPEKRQAYYRSLLEASEQWVKARPNTTFMWIDRLDAMEHLDDVPVAEIVATANRALNVNEENAGSWGPDSYVYFFVSELFTKKKIQPERVLELVPKGLSQSDVEAKRPDWDLYSEKKWIDEANFYRASQRLEGLALEADAYLQLKQTDKAREALSQLNQRMQDLQGMAGDKDNWKKACASRQASCWGLMARLADFQGHKQDAMAFYENALLTRLTAGVKPEPGEKDELAENAHQLWTSLGGSEDGWQMWYARPAAELASKSQLTWEKAHDPLPSFKLTDLKGKTWQLADLKGKEVFLNFWASW